MNDNREFAAAVHVLLEPKTIRGRTAGYIDFEREGIDFGGLLGLVRGERPTSDGSGWSDSERLLVRVAFDMWNGGGQATLGECIHLLDETNLQVVLDAVAIRRGLGVPVEAGGRL